MIKYMDQNLPSCEQWPVLYEVSVGFDPERRFFAKGYEKKREHENTRIDRILGRVAIDLGTNLEEVKGMPNSVRRSSVPLRVFEERFPLDDTVEVPSFAIVGEVEEL
jgi:hypothetical protein